MKALNRLISIHLTIGLTIIAAVLSCLLPSLTLANSAWSDRPAWANDNPVGSRPVYSSKSVRSTRYQRGSGSSVTPFSPGSNNLSLDLGQVFLMGGLSEQYVDNIGTQVHYTYGVSDMFAFDSALGFSKHSDGKFTMVNLSLGLRTNLAWYDHVVVYVNYGLGFYNPIYNLSDGDSISPVLFGIHIGPGVDLRVTDNLFFGTSLTFHDIFGSSRVVPGGAMEVGGTYTSLFIRAGATF